MARCCSNRTRAVELLRVVCCAAITTTALLSGTARLHGQAVQLPSFGGRVPFVTGFVPVIGRNGAVGGVSIDAEGVVGRAEIDEVNRLKAAQANALRPAAGEMRRASKLRKVSLRRLEAEIAMRLSEGKPLTDEIHCLAGLQRAEYVFVYPELNDIVIAGFAEGWKVDGNGEVVGVTTGRPVLRLDDLLVALQTAEAAARADGITCSIDPDPQGVRRLQQLLGRRGFQLNRQTAAQMETVTGPQRITLTGVPSDSHFARVMVAADFIMKQLAMNLERSPVAGMPSFMELLQNSSARAPRNMMPRWWLAVNYQPMLKSADGLAWQIRGQGVQVLTEQGYLADGEIKNPGRAHPLAKRWSETMTDKYSELAAKVPAFAKLRNCMDLAVVAALISRYEMTDLAGYRPTWLTNPKALAPQPYQTPRQVSSRASFVRKGRSWVVSVSGGVDLDSWSVIEKVEVSPPLAETHRRARASDQAWWWD